MGVFLLIVGGLIFLWGLSKSSREARATYYIKQLTDQDRQFLHRICEFYTLLPPLSKRKFEQLVALFISKKRFIARDMPEVTREMKLAIASAACQITFGLPTIILAHFKQIIIYPNAFRSKYHGQLVEGEVATEGYIFLSWEHILKGLAKKRDGRNVVLHEMAHALRIEDVIDNGKHKFFDQVLVGRFMKMAKREIHKIRGQEDYFLRQYAGSNSEEYWAVCIESFFERPIEFRHNLPEIYNSLKLILQQDPVKLYEMRAAKKLKSPRS